MSRRIGMMVLTTTATIGLVVPSLATPAAAHPQRPSADPSSWCSGSVPAPCVTSASRDGIAVTSSDPNWDIEALGGAGSDGGYLVLWDVQPVGGSGLIDMGTGELGHTWSVSIDMGTHIPRATDTTGDDGTVTREANDDGTYDVTVTGEPTTIEDNSECDPGCPPVSGKEVTYFGGDIDTFGQWEDAQQRNDFYGMDTWSNIESYDSPPSIIGDPAQLVVDMDNSHERPDHSEFHGFYHLTMPDAFLADMGVNDPSTLGAGGLSATIGAGTATVTPGASTVQVDVTGITFSPRTLRVKRGTVTPTRPTKLRAHRSSAHLAHLSFHHAKARGSQVTGYQARCTAHHHSTRKASGKHSPLVDKKLAAGVTYRCQVRAKSKAGYGNWSKHRTLH